MDENALTTEDCQIVLVQAKDPFLACMDKLSEDDADVLNTADKTLVLYYLEAVVILGHVQRPSVVQNMTVSEWLSRDKAISKETGEPLWVVGVKTSTQQVATFALSKEEEHVSSQQFLPGHVRRQNIFSLTAEHNLIMSFSPLYIIYFLLQWFDLYQSSRGPPGNERGMRMRRIQKISSSSPA